MYSEHDFDTRLIYSPDAPYAIADDVPWIHRVRRVAQILEPNCQDNVAQAVQADVRYFLNMVCAQVGPRMGFDEIQMQDLLSWISYYIGKGDPMCGNWLTWSALVFEGNSDIFKNNRDMFLRVIAEHDMFRFAKQHGPHPELKALLDDFAWHTHFSAVRIPLLSFDPDISVLNISWPGSLEGTEGTPPTAILFLNNTANVQHTYIENASCTAGKNL